MSAFVFFYLLVYGLINAVIYRRLLPLLPPGPWRWALLAWAAAMVLAPIAARLLERAGHPAWAEPLAWVGFHWMGLMLLAFAAAVLSLLVQASGVLLHNGWWHRDRLFALICLGVSLAAFGYGLWEVRQLTVEHLRVPVAGLPAGTKRVRLVMIADVHLGLMVGRDRLTRIAAVVAAQKPDVILSAGDLVDGSLVEDGRTLAGVLAGLKAPLGKYAVLGNHEFYVGVPASLAFLRRAGFVVLRGQMVSPGGLFNLAGVDDPGHGNVTSGEGTLLARGRPGLPTVLLKHRPRVSPEARGHFDLMLSGHTHKGQIFPYSLLTRIAYPHLAGLYPAEGGGILYVSRGTATWGPPIRVLARPEVTVIDLVPLFAARGRG